MAKLSIVEGIGDVYEGKLKNAGIGSLEKYLEACQTKKGRKELAAKADISEKLILKWANHADLMRIKGIGGQYSELLEAAGVDTVPELSQRNAENLTVKMQEVNLEKKLVRQVPTLKMVKDWIQQAQDLPRVLEY